MAFIFKQTALQPALTGALLLVLTRGSPELRQRLVDRPISKFPWPHFLSRFKVSEGTVVTSLKWLFALGLARVFHNWLNKKALNKGQSGNAGGKEWVWPKEIAVVTGGSGGIGSEMIKKLAPTGMNIAIVDIVGPGAELQSMPNVHFFQCDITNPASVHEVAERIRKELGNPSILVNNAGIGKTYSIIDAPDGHLEKIFHINLISHWYTVREFLPAMIMNKKGHIVTTASMASYSSVAGMVDYCVTKAGCVAFHEGLNQELKHRYNAPFIKTTSIHPLWVSSTGLTKDWVESNLKSLKTPMLNAKEVGKVMANAILSGKSGQTVLPNTFLLNLVTMARGLPIWFLEGLNDSTKDHTRDVN